MLNNPFDDHRARLRASPPSRYVGMAILLLVAMALMTSPLWGKAPTPYDTINQAAATQPVTRHQLRGGVAMLEGSGGNIGVLVGPDGLLMVDAGIAVSEAKIKAALAAISGKPLRTAILTHWHWDHSDGDGWVRRTGAHLWADQATIARLKRTTTVVEWGHTFTPVAARDLPDRVVDGEKTIAFGRETVRIGHYRPSHTDGDMWVYFQKADVLQTGDTFWNGVYPFIDYVSGGSIDGAIRAADANLRLAKPRTLVIPGHGPIGDRAALLAFRDMLFTVRGKVAALKAQGKSLAEVQAARPTAAFDAKWGKSIISGTLFTALVYRGV